MVTLNWESKAPYNENTANNITENSGVYIICNELNNSNYIVRYVGQASDLKKRLTEHFYDTEENEELKRYLKKDYIFKVYYAKVSRQSDRDKIESFLYNKFKPIFNNISPPGDEELEVNLPSDVV